MEPLGGGKDATAALFAAQHAVLQRRQALAAGLTPKTIEVRLRTGTWVAVHQAVYRLVGAPTTWRLRVMAACLAAGPGAVASHRAAGALWGLDGVVEGRPEITVAMSGGRELADVVVHHTRGLHAADRATVDGIPCTSAARTLVDLAGVLTPHQLEAALDSALRDRLTAARYLQRRLAGAGRKGAGVLRELVEDRAGQRPHEGPKEAELLRALVAAGLPRPVRQFELRHEGRVIAGSTWPDARLAVEYQSFRHHFGRQAWRQDAGRANRAAAFGWRVFMATEEDVRDRCVTLAADIARVRAA